MTVKRPFYLMQGGCKATLGVDMVIETRLLRVC